MLKPKYQYELVRELSLGTERVWDSWVFNARVSERMILHLNQM